MVLDYSGAVPNAARDRRLKLPLAEPDEVEPPHADHVEAAAWLLTPSYLVGLLVLDATGARVGEIAAATIGDLDEARNAWLVRAKVAKTRRARWVELPEDLFRVVVEWLPAREDRDPEAPLFPIVSTDRLRMAISRACRDAGCAGVQSTRSSPSANQSAASPRGELGRDRCACRPAEHQHDGGYL